MKERVSTRTVRASSSWGLNCLRDLVVSLFFTASHAMALNGLNGQIDMNSVADEVLHCRCLFVKSLDWTPTPHKVWTTCPKHTYGFRQSPCTTCMHMCSFIWDFSLCRKSQCIARIMPSQKGDKTYYECSLCIAHFTSTVATSRRSSLSNSDHSKAIACEALKNQEIARSMKKLKAHKLKALQVVQDSCCRVMVQTYGHFAPRVAPKRANRKFPV